MKSYSVVIIGGGPAGSTAAMALSKLGINNILILESGEYDKFVIGESIPPETKNVFNRLGIFNNFLKEGHLPCYGTCSYWGDDKKGFNDTILSPYGHGWHLDRSKFNLFLSRQAQNMGAKLHINSTFTESINLDDGRRKVIYQRGDTTYKVLTDFVIDASGSKSVFSLEQGSKQIKGESLNCLTRRFKINSEDTISSLTRIEAVENGWWYGAKLPNNELLIALYTDQETVKQSKIQHLNVWMDALDKTISIKEGVHSDLALDKNVKGFHANSFCLDQLAGENWLAIGDAASAYDPITSRGVYKSLTDACSAAELVAHYLTNNESSFEAFENYVKGNYDNYLIERAHYYSIEQRWSDHPFWTKFHNLNKQISIQESVYS
jgi:flavin-dependent dehydrogenase